MNKIIALDPGIARTGFAIMVKTDADVQAIEYGCITTKPSQMLEKRLEEIYKQLNRIVLKHKPTKMILEKVFFNNNQKTAITVGQAQGAMLLVAAKHKLTVEFVTPLQIKSALTGYGMAKKDQVQKMVTTLLCLKEIPKPDDTADALACGLTYLYHHQFSNYL